MPVDRSARPPRPPRPPRPETLTEVERHHRHDAIELMLTNPHISDKDRLDVFRALLPTDLRDAIGRLYPEMVPAVAQAALEFPTKEQQGWMREVLTDHALAWTAQYGSAASIGKLAQSISISGLPMEERAGRLEKLLNLRGPACVAVAESLNASAIANTAYAMANCWPVHLEDKWLETLQNVVLSEACVAEVARSGNHSHLSSAAWAATMFPDKDRRNDALRALLSEKNCSILQNHASLHPNSLAVAVFSAQQLPPDECGPVLETLISTAAVSAVLRERDGYGIASLALGAWHLGPLQRNAVLKDLLTTENCAWVSQLKNENATGIMRKAVEHLPEDLDLRREMLGILRPDQGPGSDQELRPDQGRGSDQELRPDQGQGSDQELRPDQGPGSDQELSVEKQRYIEQWADEGLGEMGSSGPLADPQQELSQPKDAATIVSDLWHILQDNSAEGGETREMVAALLDPKDGACVTVARSLEPTAIATTASAMSTHLLSEVTQAESEWSKAFQELFSKECLNAVTSSGGLWVGLMTVGATCLPDESQRMEVLKELMTDGQCDWLKQRAKESPVLLAAAAKAALCLPEQDCQRVLGLLVTKETCSAVAEKNDETSLKYMLEGANHLPDGPHRQAALEALVPVPQWQRALDASSGSPMRSRDRSPSPGGH